MFVPAVVQDPKDFDLGLKIHVWTCNKSVVGN